MCWFSESLVEAAAPASLSVGFKFNERERDILPGSCHTSPGIQQLDHLGSCAHFCIGHNDGGGGGEAGGVSLAGGGGYVLIG